MFIISFVLIFGFYIMNEYGFWPLTWTINLFKEMIGEIVITPEEIQLFRIFRIILIVICIVIFVFSIIGKKQFNKDVEDSILKKTNTVKGTLNFVQVMAIIGFVVSVVAIFISGSF